MSKKTFVYENQEIVLTGRSAVKQVSNRQFTLLEITPLDKDIGWKKWVRREDLYEICEDSADDAQE
jgi:hypothetical protein